MKKIILSLFLWSALACANSYSAISADTMLSDMSKTQQSEIASLVRTFDVEKFTAKLCANYIVIVTRNEDVSKCKEAIGACNLPVSEMSCKTDLDAAVAQSSLTGKRVVECVDVITRFNSALPAFNCFSEKSDSNMMILEQLATSRFPEEVESCTEDLRRDQIGFY